MTDLANPVNPGTAEELSEPMTIGVEAYVSEDYARAERDKLWRKVWQQVGRVEELPEVGSYLTYDILDDSIIVVRSAPDKISAFYNVCQHRGMLLMTGEQGHSRRLVCPYHGWAYDLKGTLRVVPEEADYPQGSPCGKLNLVEIPCEVWAGFVWFNMDPKCKSLRESLAPIVDSID